MSDSNSPTYEERMYYWRTLMLVVFLGVYAPNIWEAIAAVCASFVFGLIIATVLSK